MLQYATRRMSWIVLVTGMCMIPVSDALAQFGKGLFQTKVDVTLTRKKPPKVYLMATDIEVKVTAQSPEAQGITDSLAAALQTELTSRDSRLKPSAQAGTIISAAISRLETTSDWVSRQVTVRKKTGERQVLNKKTGKYDTEPVYTDVQETQRIQKLSGGLNLSYQTADKSGAVLDSESIAASYAADFVNGEGAPTTGAIEQTLIQRAVLQIYPRIVPTIEPVKVFLGRPNDQIDELNKLAEAGLWSQMLQRLETMKPLADRKKEPYRVFNIGVANEALAYQASDITAAKALLEQAALKYAEALEMKPDEEYFRSPQTRIDTAIAAYATLERQQASYAQLVKAAEEKAAQELAAKQEAAAKLQLASAAGARSLDGKDANDPQALTNNDIIELVKSGLDNANLLATIKEAKGVKFDLSPAGLRQLLGGGVSNQLITVMRTKQQGAAAPAPARRPAAAPPANRAGTAPPASRPGTAPASPPSNRPATPTK